MAFGDSPWSLCVNCTRDQISRYLDDRAAKGCNAILFSAIEARWSNQRPHWRNVEGISPFTSMRPVNWRMQPRYWELVDHVVERALERDIACFITPAYTGYGNGSDGWLARYRHASDDMLRAYGQALGRRYRQGNVIWVLGGDDANDRGVEGAYGSASVPERTRQWQIALGLQDVIQPGSLLTGHTGRHGMPGVVNGEAWLAWGRGYAGFNLNNIYGKDGTDDVPALAARAWARPGPLPFFLIEAGYEDEDGRAENGVWPAIQAVMSGALGGFFGGHDALWHFGSHKPRASAQVVLDRHLAASWRMHAQLGAWLRQLPWSRLRPAPGRLLVPDRGSGAMTICPALTDDARHAVIWTPGDQLEVRLSDLSGERLALTWLDLSSPRRVKLGEMMASEGLRRLLVPGPGLVDIRPA